MPEAEVVWRFSRASGPGGQHVNTTDSAVEARWDVVASGVLEGPLRDRALARLGPRLLDGRVLAVHAAEHRSQWRNRQAALSRLQALLDEAVAPPPPRRRPTRKSRGVNERRLTDKKRRGDVKKGRRGEW
ncbi:aminoacyl-tRNA hydrolase [Mangrovactinospora gilvigrisea]|uniref:Aminoacyl-tRNA hydrolase n=1 Tax=Mangrovactinospora gilvigrisea TaxID=1428644 RepID=A0A1J7C6C6_9ACTN|nr:aminoacyl-tRNA hydrolase [Mangrovactinospora gilvigrisea]